MSNKNSVAVASTDPAYKNAQYHWEIPSLTIYEKELLCCGYTKLTTSLFIISPIISLFAAYFTNDETTLDDIKNCALMGYFQSEIVSIYGFKWYIELYPNGCNAYNSGSVLLFVCLASEYPSPSSIHVEYSISIREISQFHTDIHKYNSDNYYSGYILHDFKLIDLQKLNRLSIGLTIQTPNIYDKKNKLISNLDLSPEVFTELDMPRASYEWKINMKYISTCVTGDSVDCLPFSMLSFKWSLNCCPNGEVSERKGSFDIYLHLLSIPPYLSKIFVKYKLLIRETNTIWSTLHHFKPSSMSWGFRKDTIKFNDILKNDSIKSITVDLHMYLLDVYDKDGNIIKNYSKKFNLFKNNKITNIKLQKPFIHQWSITDKILIKKIKKSPEVYGFCCPIFNAFFTKWYIEFVPNGSRESRKGKLNTFLTLSSFKSTSITYVIKFSLTMIECGQKQVLYHSFTNSEYSWGLLEWLWKNDDIKNVNSFTFISEISLIDVYNNGNVVTDKYTGVCVNDDNNNNNIPFETFQWEISENILNKMKISLNGSEFKSKIFKIFGINWILIIYPNGKEEKDSGFVDIGIHSHSFPKKYKKCIFSVKYEINVIETNTKKIGAAGFCLDNKYVYWGGDRLATNKIRNIDNKSCKIILNMELIDVYDDKEENVTKKYIAKYVK